MAKISKYFFRLALILLVLRFSLLYFKIYFCDPFNEIIFFFSLIAIGLIYVLTKIKTSKNQNVFVSITIPTFFVGLFIVLFLSSINQSSKIKLEKYKNFEHKVYYNMKQAHFSGRMFDEIVIGEHYFFGLLYQELDSQTNEFDISNRTNNSDEYVLSQEIEDPQYCFLWEKRNLLIDFQNKIVYRIKKRKKNHLTTNEKHWLNEKQKELKANIKIGKGFSSFNELFDDPKTIYFTIDFKDSNYVKNLTNSELEDLSGLITNDFLNASSNGLNFNKITFHYINHDSRFLYKNGYQENVKIANFDCKTQRIISAKVETDYVIEFSNSRTSYYCIEYGKRKDKDYKIGLEKLGTRIPDVAYFGKISYKGKVEFKGLDCVKYNGVNTEKIKLKNGWLKNQFDYIFYKDELIDVTVTYECYPINKQFNYSEVLKKLTFENVKAKPEFEFYNYLNKNYLTYHFENNDYIIDCKVDTLNIPWIITYNTSINKPQFAYLYKEL